MSNDEDFESVCDHCGLAVCEEDLPDCEPDEDGYCIRCGMNICADD